MKIPSSVRIAGVEYTIEHVPNLRHNNALAYGQIDYENSVINLSTTDGTGHQHQCITLLHEILHGIIYSNNIELADEERVVDALSKGLYQVLEDNNSRIFNKNVRKGETK